MASSRKKQDENNLKTLRELAALPQNKFCFDCGQRGPTYVNVTVGSFVCTKCSGILRGITPPHRVKSISMATFTADEIDTIRTKGNDYCRKVWLGLHEGNPPAFADEQQVRDFMIEKYEKRRYYLEKNMAKMEVPNTRPLVNSNTSAKITNGVKNGFSKNFSNNNGVITNGTSRSRPEVKQNGLNNNLVNGNSFAVDFDKADIFSNTSTSSTGSSQNGFADFEHNQVYNASNGNANFSTADIDDFSIFDLQFTSHGPTLNQVPLFPKCAPSNRWSMPTSTFNAWQTQQTPLHPQNGVASPLVNSTPPPAEFDKYAALKDLDNEMKQQQQHQEISWSNSNAGSTGSLYSSSTNTGSVYSSPSPQGSIFGSPSQGQFASAFSDTNQPNPFGTSAWPTANGFTPQNGMNGITNGLGSINGLGQPGFFNPFKEQAAGKANGFQPVFPSNGLSNGWGGNPFKVDTDAKSNPFLELLRKNMDSGHNSFVCNTNDLLNPFKAALKKHVGALTTSSNPNNPFL